MELFETFMAYVLKKNIWLNQIEQKCKNLFNESLTNSLTFAPSDNLNYSINLHDICTDVYKKLLKDKIQICCLMFSDGNEIFIEKYRLYSITFFRNYFNDFSPDDNVVFIEFPMSGIIDDYDAMEYIIEFVNEGDVLINAYDYVMMGRLLKIDDYLLGVRYFLPSYYEGQMYNDVKQLKNCIGNMVITMVNKIDNKCEYEFDYVDDVFDTLYELCQMTGKYPNIYVKPNGIYSKYLEEFEKSKLVSYKTY